MGDSGQPVLPGLGLLKQAGVGADDPGFTALAKNSDRAGKRQQAMEKAYNDYLSANADPKVNPVTGQVDLSLTGRGSTDGAENARDKAGEEFDKANPLDTPEDELIKKQKETVDQGQKQKDSLAASEARRRTAAANRPTARPSMLSPEYVPRYSGPRKTLLGM